MAQLGHLTPADLEQAAALSRGIGWNQTPDDWARLLALAPGGVFGAFDAGRLVATSSVVAYGDALAWIGMMIVDAEHRGRGLGKRLLDAALASPTVPAGATVGLDATDMGAPLYRTRGFVDAEPIDRWGGALLALPPADGIAVRPVAAIDVAPLAAWDAARTGVDRAALVTHLLLAPGAGAWLATRDDQRVGYAAVRPGRTRLHLGPLLADGADAFDALVTAVARALRGAEVFADVVRDEAADAAFARAGLRVERRLTRMTRSVRARTRAGHSREDPQPAGRAVGAALRHPRVLGGGPIWAAAGLEWG